MLGLGTLKAGGGHSLCCRCDGLCWSVALDPEVHSFSVSAGEGVVCKRSIGIVRPDSHPVNLESNDLPTN